MKPNDLFVSLKVARRLKALGLNRSLYGWWRHPEKGWKVSYRRAETGLSEGEFPAFTAAELGELLPGSIPVPPSPDKKGHRPSGFRMLEIHKHSNDGTWWLNYILELTSSRSLADAMAKMLIRLVELGKVKVR